MKRAHLVLTAGLSGLLLSIPWFGVSQCWVLLVALIPLLVVEDHLFRNRARGEGILAFGYAFIGFFIWNLLATWWGMYASIVGMALVILLNSMLMAAVWWLFHAMKRSFSPGMGNFSLLIFWLAFEYLHYNWDIEWPWLSLGNGFANQVRLIQWYEFTGVLGGSAWVLAVNLLLFHAGRHAFHQHRRKLAIYSTISVVIVIMPVVISYYQYSHYQEEGESFEIILLQPNVDPYSEKFEKNTEAKQVENLLSLADSLITSSTDYVIGPETALHPVWEDDRLADDAQIRPFLLRAAAYPELNFILGAITQKQLQPFETSATARHDSEAGYYDMFNSALQINHKGIQVYHKTILVSGVEKMPYSRYFSFLKKFMVDLGGTSGSLGNYTETSVFDGSSGLITAPVVCFESAFGQHVGEQVKKGASLIFVITNDGWWKDTAGYHPHLSYARLRAIETRRGIARSANTGISAFINQKGDLMQFSGWNEKTAIKGTLNTNEKITFYVQYGDYLGRAAMFAAIMLLLYYFVWMNTRKTKGPYQ